MYTNTLPFFLPFLKQQTEFNLNTNNDYIFFSNELINFIKSIKCHTN